MQIRLSCSPDADDLFMVRALLEGLIDTGPYTFVIDSAPTDALNRLASGEGPDVIALSIAHYPEVAQSYQLLPHGGSLGEGYGPVVVANTRLSVGELSRARVAVPGLTTTAWRVLQMIVDVDPVVVPITPYARIFEALRAGEVDAGLIIHEGRLTYEDEGFYKVLDIGEWWHEQTGLPLPLGGNAIARRLGPHVGPVSDLLRQGIAHGLDHLDDAVEWLLARGGPLDTASRVRTYLGMYANNRTLDYGEAGRAGVDTFFERTHPGFTVDWAP